MKLRQIPEDFIVEEIPDFAPDPAGRFFVYEVTKRGITTLDVVDVLHKALRVPSREISASGLKDKHAIARQLISTPKPVPGTFSNGAFDVRFVGKASRPLKASNIAGNRFAITARALSEADIALIQRNAEALKRFFVPNYYDSQRFGGGNVAQLPGRAIIRQEWEEALRLHLAVPRRKQSLKDKRIRRLSAKHWGDWATLLKKLPRSRERSIVAYLVDHPDDLRGALDRINRSILSIYLAAYQSLLFNRSLDALVRANVSADHLVPVEYKAGTVMFWRELPEALIARWREVKIPLLSHTTALNEFPEDVRAAVAVALESEGMTLERLVVKGLDSVHLRGAERDVLLEPEALELSAPEADDLNPGRFKICARFQLPRGSFATIVMKRLALHD